MKKEAYSMAVIKEYRGRAPRLESPAFLAETAAIVGDVTLKRGTSVYYSAVLRADSGSITVGENTNIQDGAVLHTAAGHDVCVGCGVTIGPVSYTHLRAGLLPRNPGRSAGGERRPGAGRGHSGSRGHGALSGRCLLYTSFSPRLLRDRRHEALPKLTHAPA